MKSISEVAALRRVAKNTVLAGIRRGELDAEKVGTSWGIHENSKLDKWRPRAEVSGLGRKTRAMTETE